MALHGSRRNTRRPRPEAAGAGGAGRKATAREVADLAGVSVSAVSRAFTKGASVSPAMRSKVEAAATALGYQPNLLARSLMTRRTELVGLISNNFDNPAHMEIFDLFTRRLQFHGLRPILVNLTAGVPPNGALEVLNQYSVDGVIVASSPLHRDFAEACAKTPVPVVQAFGRPASGIAISAVSADNLQGGRVAADLLVERGYRKIAFLGGPQNATSTGDRLKGFRRRLRQQGLAPALEVYGPAFSHAAGAALMQRLLAGGADIDAVFCGDDILAMGAIDACRAAGVAVPDEIGVVGFDDMPMAAWAGYDLTTVRQPIGDIIVTAVEMILSVIQSPDQPAQTRLFPCEPVLRGTLRDGRSAGRAGEARGRQRRPGGDDRPSR